MAGSRDGGGGALFGLVRGAGERGVGRWIERSSPRGLLDLAAAAASMEIVIVRSRMYARHMNLGFYIFSLMFGLPRTFCILHTTQHINSWILNF